MNLTLGMIGLGRMGGNMSRRLARAGHTVVAWDRSPDAGKALHDEPRVATVDTLEALVSRLPAPKVVWLMLPAGAPTDETLQRLVPLLSPGDVVVDGANAMYKDSQRHAAALAAHGLSFVDAGVSGGVWGLENGYGLMVGGEVAAVRAIEPVLRALAPAADRGWVHCGPAGAGHFTKMVHNGIEYGMMQAYAEGLALMRAKTEFALDLPQITEAWRHGTVIRSWLLDLTAEFLAHDADARIDGAVRRGFGGRALDSHRVHRTRRADARHDAVADGALREPGQGRLHQPPAGTHAAGFRRARGQDEVTTGHARTPGAASSAGQPQGVATDTDGGSYQPPKRSTIRAEASGPQLPEAYCSACGPLASSRSTMSHATSTESCRANNVASPRIASPSNRSYGVISSVRELQA